LLISRKNSLIKLENDYLPHCCITNSLRSSLFGLASETSSVTLHMLQKEHLLENTALKHSSSKKIATRKLLAPHQCSFIDEVPTFCQHTGGHPKTSQKGPLA